jgi:hypothetical protein
VLLAGRGTVAAFGANTWQQCVVHPVARRGGVQAVAAGARHSLALLRNGSVFAWGDDRAGQATVPPAAQRGVVAIAAGATHSLALLSNGAVVTWGTFSLGVPASVPATLRQLPQQQGEAVIAIAAGLQFSAALSVSGNLTVWGPNTTAAGRGVVPAVPADARSNVSRVAAAGRQLALLLRNGSMLVYTAPATTTSTNITSDVPEAGGPSMAGVTLPPYVNAIATSYTAAFALQRRPARWWSGKGTATPTFSVF